MSEAIEFVKWILGEFPAVLPWLLLAGVFALLFYAVAQAISRIGPLVLHSLQAQTDALSGSVAVLESLEAHLTAALSKQTEAMRELSDKIDGLEK